MEHARRNNVEGDEQGSSSDAPLPNMPAVAEEGEPEADAGPGAEHAAAVISAPQAVVPQAAGSSQGTRGCLLCCAVSTELPMRVPPVLTFGELIGPLANSSVSRFIG